MRSRLNLDETQPGLSDLRSHALETGFDELEQESPFGETEVPLDTLNPPWSMASSDGSQFEQEYSLVSDIPVPGRFYKIKYGGGGLLETAGHAYGLKQGAERLTRAQAINSHPLNMKSWRPPGNAFERKYFGKGVISFSPRFTCGDRKCFATIWIPPAKPYVHPFLGRGVAVTGFDEPAGLRQSQLEWDEEGSFERFSARHRIDMTKVPFRWICRLRVFFKQPDGEIRQSFATGTLVGPRHVLTAAHVFDANWENDPTTPVEVLAINVAAGADGLRAPFSWSKTKPVDWRSHHNWRSGNFDPRFDFGMIRLPNPPIAYRRFRTLKNKTLSFWGNAGEVDGAFLLPVEVLPEYGIRTLIGKALNICGYRTDANGRPTLLPATVRSVGPTAGRRPIPELITYTADTSFGISGSPVWYWDDKTKRRYLVAVHHGGCGECGKPPGLDVCRTQTVGANCIADPKLGVILKQSAVRQIRGWINETYDRKRSGAP
ncbi:MAG: serine protease [Nitrospiraceae bacterium]